MEERVGFEPTDGANRHRFSRPALSTTQTSLHMVPINLTDALYYTKKHIHCQYFFLFFQNFLMNKFTHKAQCAVQPFWLYRTPQNPIPFILSKHLANYQFKCYLTLIARSIILIIHTFTIQT